tara:strand:+ start:55585 stop:55773 length:189 start_codon:yes stop_codon:yes gene_type:complete
LNITKSVKRSFDLSDKISIITGGAGLLGEKNAEAIAEFGGIPILVTNVYGGRWLTKKQVLFF